MKQHIDFEEINNSTDEVREKLLQYFKPIKIINYKTNPVATIHLISNCLTIGKIIEILQTIDESLIQCIFKTPDNKEWCCCTEDDCEGYTRSHKELIDELWSILLNKLS